jgi:hypothetical protein
VSNGVIFHKIAPSVAISSKNIWNNCAKCYTFAVSNQSIEGKVMTKKAFYQRNLSKTLVLGLIVTSGC